MSKKLCEFCRSPGPFNDEHIIPQWIAKAVGGVYPDGEFRQPDLKHGTKVFKNTFGWKTRAVCAGCNGGWLKSLEDETAPILRPIIDGSGWERDSDARRLINEEEQAVVARWAYKTMLTSELQLRRTQGLVVPKDEYKRFYRDRTPGKVQIWLSAYASAGLGWNGHMALSVNRMRIRVPMTDAHKNESIMQQLLAPSADGYVTSLQLYSAVLHFVGHFGTADVWAEPNTPGLLIPIWPIEAPVVEWPPDLACDDKTLGEFPATIKRGAYTVNESAGDRIDRDRS